MWALERFVKRAVISSLLLFSFAGWGQSYKQGEVIVKLKGDIKSTSATSFLGKVQIEKSMKLEKSWNSMNMHYFKSAAGKTTQQLIDEYRNDPSVAYVEPNYIFTKKDVGVLEAGLSKSDVQIMAAGDFGQNDANIQAEAAWTQLSTGLAKPVVAIIDTGVDYNHEVFTESSSIWTNSGEIPNNGLDDDGNGYVDDVRGWNFVSNTNDPDDDNGHGTHVAGIVLGTGQDILNTSPVETSRIELMPLKFLDSSGSGSTSAAISAIYYAVNNGAKVLNNSWGGGAYSAALHEAVAYAYEAKTVFVAAAGNETNNNDAVPTYPASYGAPNVASVAATTDSDFLASFSNFGASSVHMGSPGFSILSTFTNNTYGRSSGTSMAAPFVAGIAALILYEQPTMNGFQIRDIIMNQTQFQASLQSKVSSQGRVNVLNAVTLGKGATVNPNQPNYDISIDQFGRDLASAMDDGGSACGLVREMGGPAGSGSPLFTLLLLTVLVAPLFVARYLRQEKGSDRRRHERFEIDTDVAMTLGGKQLNGKISSISQGGAQLNTEEMLEHGSIVTMTISSPEGGEQIQVQGCIVWSEENKRYGVQFDSAADRAKASISNWTRKLKPEET